MASSTRRTLLPCLCLLGALTPTHILWADDWPQWLGPQRDGVWRESGLLEAFPKSGPVIAWRTSIGSGYAGPAVANGRVYVADRVLPSRRSHTGEPF